MVSYIVANSATNNPMTLTNAFSVAINRGKSKKITVMNNNVLHSL